MTSSGQQGLQAERTALAWSRTSLGVLVNGVLLVLKEPRNDARPVAAGLALVVAVTIYLVGVRRHRALARGFVSERAGGRGQVQFVGVAVLVLITVTAVGLFL